MKWGKADQDVGFDIERDPTKDHAEMVRQSRNLFILLGLISGLILPALTLYRAGATVEHRLAIDAPGLVLRAEPRWEAERVGSWSEARPELFAEEVLADGESYRPAPAAPAHSSSHGDEHGESHGEAPAGDHADEKTDEKKAAAPAAKPAFAVEGMWFKLEGPVTPPPELAGGQEGPVSAEGWVAAEAIAHFPSGPAEAYALRATKLHVMWGIGGLCILLGLFAAEALVPLVKKWFQYVVEPLGHVNTRILLSGVFFVCMAPLAIYWRLTDKDPLDRAMQPDRPSYWNEKPELKKDHFVHRF